MPSLYCQTLWANLSKLCPLQRQLSLPIRRKVWKMGFFLYPWLRDIVWRLKIYLLKRKIIFQALKFGVWFPCSHFQGLSMPSGTKGLASSKQYQIGIRDEVMNLSCPSNFKRKVVLFNRLWESGKLLQFLRKPGVIRTNNRISNRINIQNPHKPLVEWVFCWKVFFLGISFLLVLGYKLHCFCWGNLFWLRQWQGSWDMEWNGNRKRRATIAIFESNHIVDLPTWYKIMIEA